MSRRSSRRASSTITTLIILAIVLILTLYEAWEQNQPAPPPSETVAAVEGGWYSLYFTEPVAFDGSYRGGPDQALAEAISKARLTVDIAAYEFDLPSVADALLDAHRQGVRIRVVTDSDYMDEIELQDLIAGGIPVLGDRRVGLMHNKFVVIDGMEVWTGSMNLTRNGAYRNNNNLVRIRSTLLAERYTSEFEEMFVHDAFGPGSPSQFENPSMSVNGVLLEVYFSPEDDTIDRLVELVREAQESIYFMAFSYTSDELAETMIARAANGVTIAGVMEASQYRSNVGTEYERLRLAGVDVRLDGNPRSMHHKVIILDEQIVVTGSYNFSANAETRNDENSLVIHDPGIASRFLEEFQRVFLEALE